MSLMDARLGDSGLIHCEVATGFGHFWRLCSNTPRWRCSSVLNAAVITHCCDTCLHPFLAPYERDNWCIESLTLQFWNN